MIEEEKTRRWTEYSLLMPSKLADMLIERDEAQERFVDEIAALRIDKRDLLAALKAIADESNGSADWKDPHLEAVKIGKEPLAFAEVAIAKAEGRA